jgi:Flp pilus assembly pilin Flp
MIAGALSIVIVGAVDLLGGNVKSMLFDQLASVTAP